MAVQVSYPGVYIEEFTPGAPIQGVGTSTAALIGVAARGALNAPTKVTSWDQFRAVFGEQPVPGFFLWYAARGFFENGGQVCYVVRASNGQYDRLGYADQALAALTNLAGDPLIRVRARQPGDLAQPIAVQITDASLVPNTTLLYRAEANYTVTDSRTLTIGAGGGATADEQAAQLRPGDTIDLGAGQPPIVVTQVAGATLRVGADMALAAGAAGTLRLANLLPGARTVRLAPAAALPPGAIVPGTVLTITQGTAPNAVRDTQVVESVRAEVLATAVPTTTHRVTFREGLRAGFALAGPDQAAVQSHELTVTITQGTASIPYQNLGVDPAHPRHYPDVVNGDLGGLVVLELIEPPPARPLPDSLPAPMGAAVQLDDGANEDLTTLDAPDFITALDTLRTIDDVNLVAAPDCLRLGTAAQAPVRAATVQQAVIAHCELLADRFAVLDARPGLPPFGQTGSIEAQRLGLDSTRGYAALYYPWLRVAPAGLGPPILVPPTGHICGIIARSDTSRGVHKAPANEIVNGSVGVERALSDIDQGQLNLQGINVVRVFAAGGRPNLWGARTTATDRNWQYVNVRRLFLFLEESIQEGIRWAVFEPNDLGLWQKLRRTISEFLTRAWRDGALFGATPDEAFYVRIDEVLNPFSEQALGRLNIEIGVRPTYPAEFIIVRIGIWPGGSEVSE